VKFLSCHHFLTTAKRAPIVVGKQVAVVFAKGIANLAHDGPQCAVLTMAKPETEGIENVSQDTPKGVQPNLP